MNHIYGKARCQSVSPRPRSTSNQKQSISRTRGLCAVSGPAREEIEGSRRALDGPKKGTLKEPLETTGDSLRRTVEIGSSEEAGTVQLQ